ncbi:hypothetical protein CMV_024304 [Castanea mollissima]|uniref:Uncharacterized protein n=1 Tax=Castanea mollissima TaxID=60419 RepID=A0A8J4QNC8_9ROSI|nr:hypothetical protein CMV_024304 [Castanea mollissima]
MTTKLAESLSYQYMGDFNRTPIPTFLGSMASLTHLGLSYSNFSGRIPHQLGNLSNLCYLNLAGAIPHCLKYWQSLTHLNLGSNDISAKKLPPLVSESRHYLAKREWYRFMLFKMNRWQRYCTRSYFLVLS